MDYSSVFHLISAVIQKEGISCVIIGGYAVNYHKVSRQTVDVDFMIVKEDFERIRAALMKAGYKEENLQEGFAQFKSKSPTLKDVNFMLVEKSTFDKIFKQAERFSIGGREFFLPSLEHLIAMKLHSIKFNYKIRWMKDLPDIINLVKVNKIDTRAETFKELCLKFGTEELYQKIKEATDG